MSYYLKDLPLSQQFIVLVNSSLQWQKLEIDSTFLDLPISFGKQIVY